MNSWVLGTGDRKGKTEISTSERWAILEGTKLTSQGEGLTLGAELTPQGAGLTLRGGVDIRGAGLTSHRAGLTFLTLWSLRPPPPRSIRSLQVLTQHVVNTNLCHPLGFKGARQKRSLCPAGAGSLGQTALNYGSHRKIFPFQAGGRQLPS